MNQILSIVEYSQYISNLGILRIEQYDQYSIETILHIVEYK